MIPQPIEASRRQAIACRAIIVFATILTFLPVVHHEFGGWDDEQNLTRNPEMIPPTISAVARYWRAPKFDLYAPMTWTVWSALARVGYLEDAPAPDAHLNPYVFHIANLALHVESALLAFELLRRLIGRDALFAATLGALLFALHPVQVEAVAWVSGLKDVLAGMLSIAAIVLFLDAKLWRKFVLAMIVFALAILSKPSAVVLPAIVIVIDVLVRRTSLRSSLTRFAPALALALIGAIMARAAQPAGQVPTIDWWQRPLIAVDAIGFYIAQIAWPVRLGVDYGRTPQHVLQSFPTGYWVVPLIVAWCVFWGYLPPSRRSAEANRWLPATLLIIMIGVFPVLGFVRFDFQEYSTVADHYLYLAMLGPALMMGWHVFRTKRWVIAVIVLALCAGLCFRQSLTWHNALTISEQAVTVNPNSKLWGDRLTTLLLESANAQADQGDSARAIETYRRVITRDPNNAIALSNLASVLASGGNPDEAIPLYERALRIDPTLEPRASGLERARAAR